MRAQNFARLLQMTEPALDLVIAALEKIRESNNRLPRASMRALAQLQAVPAVPAHPLALRTAHATAAHAEQSRITRANSRTRSRLHKMPASRLFTHTNRFRRWKSGRGRNVHR